MTGYFAWSTLICDICSACEATRLRSSLQSLAKRATTLSPVARPCPRSRPSEQTLRYQRQNSSVTKFNSQSTLKHASRCKHANRTDFCARDWGPSFDGPRWRQQSQSCIRSSSTPTDTNKSYD
eukprot:13392924-Alexandrium_andersonii.AAC.1